MTICFQWILPPWIIIGHGGFRRCLVRKPVKDYALAVTVSDYVDLRLLDVLRNQFRGKVLLNGWLDGCLRPQTGGGASGLSREE